MFCTEIVQLQSGMDMPMILLQVKMTQHFVIGHHLVRSYLQCIKSKYVFYVHGHLNLNEIVPYVLCFFYEKFKQQSVLYATLLTIDKDFNSQHIIYCVIHTLLTICHLFCQVLFCNIFVISK